MGLGLGLCPCGPDFICFISDCTGETIQLPNGPLPLSFTLERRQYEVTTLALGAVTKSTDEVGTARQGAVVQIPCDCESCEPLNFFQRPFIASDTGNPSPSGISSRVLNRMFETEGNFSRTELNLPTVPSGDLEIGVNVIGLPNSVTVRFEDEPVFGGQTATFLVPGQPDHTVSVNGNATNLQMWVEAENFVYPYDSDDCSWSINRKVSYFISVDNVQDFGNNVTLFGSGDNDQIHSNCLLGVGTRLTFSNNTPTSTLGTQTSETTATKIDRPLVFPDCDSSGGSGGSPPMMASAGMSPDPSGGFPES